MFKPSVKKSIMKYTQSHKKTSHQFEMPLSQYFFINQSWFIHFLIYNGNVAI